MSFDQPPDALFALLGTAAEITEYVSLYKDLVRVSHIVSDPASDIISCIKFWL